eukprot:CAMPEP_0181221552 /NCGR_PEP_ID=MMETSP1096-20121128/29472_1 /TAXON_ID=156174 ORGANISM="Chrysochromulina ericina, Strain CCMP281" /NCGR_SAMPLE_ID=MMETSP1096 /ASSEMBLY_ACC=CAM_ASM_000453 /LENGTH=128 /DNA_ID=CAMNT_0023314211 /DNA_START=71 /DNA_END=457 /DNA_ORIENTATION=+
MPHTSHHPPHNYTLAQAAANIRAASDQLAGLTTEPADDTQQLPQVQGYTNVFGGSFIHLRNAPSLAATPVGRLKPGEVCHATAMRGDWICVVPPGGADGAGGRGEAWALLHHPVHGELLRLRSTDNGP